ncbi:MAG: thymidylate synthase (FAD) [Candidatus Omnitrophica bacterium]|nr:thymidylate synthase (FAD) [Candidatus Omnitrophota bacterium]
MADMKIHLAGFNVDTGVLREMEAFSGKREDLTPEVLSAAYARISRDPRPISEIRRDARAEVERTRRSNSTIIFKMGHHSVAEHAVFNIDIIGASRLAMEEIEKFRLCSYTEKSQRYITLDKDFVVPEEIKGTPLEKEYTAMIHSQNEAYFTLYGSLKEHVFRKNPELASDPRKHNLLEGWAKEDARYVTALATEAQVGQTINARSLELLLRRFASHPLEEVKTIGREIYSQVSEVAPSIVIFSEANDRDLKTYPELKEKVSGFLGGYGEKARDRGEVSLADHTRDGDDAVAAALVHTSSSLPYGDCLEVVRGMKEDEKRQLFKSSWRNLQFYDTMLREFEYASLTYDIVLSAACFGQLKRHRMSTITSQGYDPSLGLTVPENIREIGKEEYFREIAGRSAEVYDKIKKVRPHAAPYILTNAHRKRVLMRLNARELYHISRLREDAHAQWDIRNIAGAMSNEAKKVMPMTFSLLGGKDRYGEVYKEIFGNGPKVRETVLPGARKIRS